MADTTVLCGQYGYYFPYEDDTGKHGLKILDDVYNKYYKPGHLTDAHISAMLEGATISFNMPNKNGSGYSTISAKVIPHTTKAGKDCKIIQFDSDQVSDDKIIEQNSEKIVTSYWDGNRFNYMKPQAVIDTLNLLSNWRTWSENQYAGDIKLGTVKIYKSKSRSNFAILLYCKVENNICSMITEEQYKVLKSEAEAKRDAEYAKRQAEYQKCNTIKDELTKWLNDIIDKIWSNGNITDQQILSNAEQFLVNINVSNLEDRLIAFMSSKKSARMTMHKYINDMQNYIKNIRVYRCPEPSEIQVAKDNLLSNLKICVEYLKIYKVREDLLKEVEQSGLAAVTENIDIDTALNLGYFPTVQKILVKYKQKAPQYIITNMYIDILDPADLRDKLLNLLKIYYDFYDMPEKDRKAIAKYIAKNKLSEYYERISSFDEVLETLIGESRDPRLTKPLLESIAGTSRANCLKDKTFYFEKIGRLRSDIFLYKPIELLDRLRVHIKEFNASSDVAILTNIELNSDESFVFQFYTFAGNNSAEGEFDGRRMLNLTRIYNRHHPTEKIGFMFENTSSE